MLLLLGKEMDSLVLWGSLEESGNSKLPTWVHKTPSSLAGRPGGCDPKGDPKKKGKTEVPWQASG